MTEPLRSPAPRRRAALLVALLTASGGAIVGGFVDAFVGALSPVSTAQAQTDAAPAGETAVDASLAGRAALDAGRPEEALGHYDRALAADPDLDPAIVGRGRALLALDRVDEAIALFNRFLNANPNNTAALHYRGVALYRAGELNRAVDDLAKAAQSGAPFSVVYLRLGDAYYARGDARQALESYRFAADLPDRTAAAFRALGNAHFALGQFPEAELAYSQALELDPNDGRAVYYRAWARERQDRPLDALSDYDRAAETLEGLDANFYIERGYLLRRLGRTDRAVADFEAALSLEPRSTAARFGAAASLVDLYQVDHAMPLLDELVDEFGESSRFGPSVLVQRGRAHLLRRDYPAAEADLNRALTLEPGDPDARFNRALARFSRGDVSGALDDIRQVARLRPGQAAAFYMLSRIAIAARLEEEALAAAQEAERLAAAAAALAPTDWADAQLDRGRYLIAIGEPDAAVAVFDGVFRANPNDVRALRWKIVALLSADRPEAAFAAARQLVAIAPGDATAHMLEAEAWLALPDPNGALAELRGLVNVVVAATQTGGAETPAQSGAHDALNRARALGAPEERLRLATGRAWLLQSRLTGSSAALAQAEAAFDAAVAERGPQPGVLRWRAAAFERLGRIEDAQEDLDRAVAISPQDAELRFARAAMLSRLGRCDEAMTDFDAGLSIRPGDDVARSARARCALAEGDYLTAAGDYIANWF